ncbi:hypothetical protein EG329_007157 [Mollisiaceae sp. DMI_Dod_QoI]|nr:hypothetical protein EG329_007157 [Helotiales sp. DMI_Dod_QoI]
MISKYTATLVAATAFLSASNVAAFSATNAGCYSSTTGLTANSTDTFNSAGYCSTQCLGMAMPVMATKDSTCYCGNTLPPASTVADNSSCTTQCPGYPSDLCGGTGYYSIYLTGLTLDVTNADASPSDTSSASAAKATAKTSATTSASPSVVTVGGQTVVVTASSSATGAVQKSSSSSGPSKAGIAAGVVIGIVAIAAIGGGLYLFIRNKRRRAVEEEYRRNAAVSSFINGGKPPSSSGGTSSFNDMRLDPAVMAQRRMSDGSIADNQDYSRRILKVTNA